MNTLRRLALAAVPLAVALAQPPAASSAEAKPAAETRRHPIPGAGVLELRVPAGWTDSVRKGSGADPITVQLESPTKEALLITVFPNVPASAGGGRVREMTERAGRELLPTAVEPELVIDELAGASHVGYFYTLTDRRLVGKVPPPGEWHVVTQGHLGVGELGLSFTILSNDKAAPGRAAALGILRTASQASPI